MKLYNSTTAPNPRRVRIFLAEKNIQVPLHDMDLGKGEQRTPEFLKINPLGLVPVLELDDGTHISETVAICRYFETLHPQPALFGTGAKETALVEMWQRRAELYFFITIADITRNRHEFFKGRLQQVPEYAQVQVENLAPRLKWLDQELAGRPFIAGDKFTIADITMMVGLMFGVRLEGVKLGPDLPNLNRWYNEVSARPSAKA